MGKIEYISVEKQIEKLKSQNLIISDEIFAKSCLEQFGYSNLIKSYREPYVIISDEGKKFRSDIKFEQIVSLYILDKNLRIAVMAAMLDLEEHIKEITADVVAKAFGIHQDSYLQYRNYQNKRKSKRRFSLTGILETMKGTLDTDKEPIYHYRTKYGIVPPWILFRSVYLSTIVNFVDQLKAPEKRAMVRRLYKKESNISEEQLISLMMDTLYISLEYRNIAAHGGRIFNYKCNKGLRSNSNERSGEGFCLLLSLLNFLEYQSPYKYLENALTQELNRHCKAFPQDVTYLSQILNLNITSYQIAWINSKSNKYHLNKHCSGLKNAREIELKKAKELGFIKCRKCCG